MLVYYDAIFGIKKFTISNFISAQCPDYIRLNQNYIPNKKLNWFEYCHDI